MRKKTRSLYGQLVRLILGGIFVSQFVMLCLFLMLSDERLDEFEDRYINNMIIRVLDRLQNTPRDEWEELLTFAQNPEVIFYTRSEPIGIVPSGPHRFDGLLKDLPEGIATRIDTVERTYAMTLEFWFTDDFANCFGPVNPAQSKTDCPYHVISLEVAPDDWLIVKIELLPDEITLMMPMFVSIIVSLISLAIFVALAVRRITAPLQALSQAAERMGRGDHQVQLPAGDAAELETVKEAFLVMQDRISRFVGDRTKMLAAISHDLRTPITSLRLWVEFVGDAEIRQKMTQNLEDMQKMVEASLTFARQELEEETPEQIDLASLVREVSEDYAGITLSGTVDTVTVLGTRLDLKRMLRNILDNAMTYGGSGIVSIDINQDQAVLCIRDPGPGVAPQHMDRIFDPFYRADKARDTSAGNVGLGLSIVKSVIRKHGGTITARNLNPGFEVLLYLPLA